MLCVNEGVTIPMQHLKAFAPQLLLQQSGSKKVKKVKKIVKRGGKSVSQNMFFIKDNKAEIQ